MALHLADLDARTRRSMLDELEADVAGRRLYLSPYLTAVGRVAYAGVLRAALHAGNDESLAAKLRRPGWMGMPNGWKPGGLVSTFSSTVPDALAEAEFHASRCGGCAAGRSPRGAARSSSIARSRARRPALMRTAWSACASTPPRSWRTCGPRRG